MSNNLSADVVTTMRSLEPRQGPSTQEIVQKQAMPVDVKPAESGYEINEKGLMTADDLVRAIDNLNQTLQAGKRNLAFSIDKVTGSSVVRVMNTNTGELVRQFPQEEVLKAKQNLDYMMGILFDANT